MLNQETMSRILCMVSRNVEQCVNGEMRYGDGLREVCRKRSHGQEESTRVSRMEFYALEETAEERREAEGGASLRAAALAIGRLVVPDFGLCTILGVVV